MNERTDAYPDHHDHDDHDDENEIGPHAGVPQDAVAREAARLIETGGAASIGAAIRHAAERLRYPSDRPLPGHGRVRKHAQMMAMQAMGDEGYRAYTRGVLTIAEEVMTALETAFPDLRARLVGRAADAKVDAGVTLYIRANTEESTGTMAELLVEFGYEEPTFDTAETAFGRLSRLKFEDDGQPVVITRCPPEARVPTDVDLFSKRTLPSLDLTGVRRLIGEHAE